MRKCGVLLAVSSIPSKYGIGAFSKEAYAFVDFLEKAGQKLWQILPLGPTGYGDSPYQSFSTFAGNPYYIDLEALIEEGLVSKEECDSYDFGDHPEYIDYEKIYLSRFKALRTAYNNSNIAKNADFQKFIADNAYWLDDYALYMAVKNKNGSKGWNEWDEDIKLRKPEAVAMYKEKLKDEIAFYQFQQFYFAKQWFALKTYANEKGIEIVGDIPIYVAFDSADAWTNPELFQFDDTCTPTGVAGCPPDAFSATGQLWGNPLYDWEYHKSTGYDWWMKRIGYCYQLYDVVRIDHFRGFDEYYNIPYGDPTAENGKWMPGPGYELFKTMKEKIGDKPVIAEDLGFLTDSVVKLIEDTGYPGMKILQFAFDSRDESGYLPSKYTQNCVVYTGTHDNDTVVGWFNTIEGADKEFAKSYVGIADDAEPDYNWKFIKSAMASVADTAVIPIQDYLGLGSEARINIPSTLGTNWKWRLKVDACTDELAQRMKELAKECNR